MKLYPLVDEVNNISNFYMPILHHLKYLEGLERHRVVHRVLYGNKMLTETLTYLKKAYNNIKT